MILSVTLNPSVDICYRLDSFEIDHIHRCEDVIKTAGGKGLNVARVLKQLKAEVVTTGFLGGVLGEFIKNELDKSDIKNDFVDTNVPVRNCISIISNNTQTEILEKGYEIEKEYMDEFLSKYENLCSLANIISISGSNPKGVENSYIERLLEIARKKQCKVILDVSGNLLYDVVNNFKTKPYAIKPNTDEIKLITKNEITDTNVKEILLGIDIPMILLSCGKDGSYIKHENKVYKINIPKIKSVNPVGSGDSSVAGMAYALENNMDIQSLSKLSNACGMSNCMSEKTGYIDIDVVKDLQSNIEVVEI